MKHAGRRCIQSMVIALGSAAVAVEAQVVVKPQPVQAIPRLSLRVGDSLRVHAGPRRFDARFVGWIGDTLLVDLFRERTFIPLDDVDLLQVRMRSPVVALWTGAIGGGLGGLLARSIQDAFSAPHDEIPTRGTAFARGMIMGASLSLVIDYINPRFRSRYDRARSK